MKILIGLLLIGSLACQNLPQTLPSDMYLYPGNSAYYIPYLNIYPQEDLIYYNTDILPEIITQLSFRPIGSLTPNNIQITTQLEISIKHNVNFTANSIPNGITGLGFQKVFDSKYVNLHGNLGIDNIATLQFATPFIYSFPFDRPYIVSSPPRNLAVDIVYNTRAIPNLLLSIDAWYQNINYNATTQGRFYLQNQSCNSYLTNYIVSRFDFNNTQQSLIMTIFNRQVNNVVDIELFGEVNDLRVPVFPLNSNISNRLCTLYVDPIIAMYIPPSSSYYREYIIPWFNGLEGAHIYSQRAALDINTGNLVDLSGVSLAVLPRVSSYAYPIANINRNYTGVNSAYFYAPIIHLN